MQKGCGARFSGHRNAVKPGDGASPQKFGRLTHAMRGFTRTKTQDSDASPSRPADREGETLSPGRPKVTESARACSYYSR